MNKHIQVREIPHDVHAALKARAASQGLSMSDFLRRLIERELAHPAWDDIAVRMRALPRVELRETARDMVRGEREAR